MERIVNFVEDTFALEARAGRAYRLTGPDAFNALFDELVERTADDAIRFDLNYRRGDWPPYRQRAYARETSGIAPRHLFKISRYPGPVWAVYCSVRAPAGNALSYLTRYWIAERNGKLCFVAQDTFDRSGGEAGWRFTGGDRSVRDLREGSQPDEVLRLRPPSDDTLSLTDYHLNH